MWPRYQEDCLDHPQPNLHFLQLRTKAIKPHNYGQGNLWIHSHSRLHKTKATAMHWSAHFSEVEKVASLRCRLRTRRCHSQQTFQLGIGKESLRSGWLSCSSSESFSDVRAVKNLSGPSVVSKIADSAAKSASCPSSSFGRMLTPSPSCRASGGVCNSLALSMSHFFPSSVSPCDDAGAARTTAPAVGASSP